MTATQRAWQLEFKGDAATVLLQTISSFLDKQRNPYSRQATIVNSSGTGKSRMVDQLARKIITVPMCLCPEESDGDTFLLILFGVLIIRFKKGTLLLMDHLFLGFFLGNHGSKGYLVSFMLC